jgi:hypothetical protein
MAATVTRISSIQAAIIRLDALRKELTQLGWDTTLIADTRPQPALLIRNTASGTPAITEHIYAVELGSRSFYWWTRGCGSDPAGAARIIAQAMGTPGQPLSAASVRRAGESR